MPHLPHSLDLSSRMVLPDERASLSRLGPELDLAVCHVLVTLRSDAFVREATFAGNAFQFADMIRFFMAHRSLMEISPLTGAIAEDACWPFAKDRGLMIEVNCFRNRTLGLHLLIGWLFQTWEYLLKFPSKYHPYQLSNKTEIEKCRFKDLSFRKTS